MRTALRHPDGGVCSRVVTGYFCPMSITDTAAPRTLDFPAAEGRTVTEGHAAICRERGHAVHRVDGVATGVCPRCGEVTEAGADDRPAQLPAGPDADLALAVAAGVAAPTAPAEGDCARCHRRVYRLQDGSLVANGEPVGVCPAPAAQGGGHVFVLPALELPEDVAEYAPVHHLAALLAALAEAGVPAEDVDGYARRSLEAATAEVQAEGDPFGLAEVYAGQLFELERRRELARRLGVSHTGVPLGTRLVVTATREDTPAPYRWVVDSRAEAAAVVDASVRHVSATAGDVAAHWDVTLLLPGTELPRR